MKKIIFLSAIATIIFLSSCKKDRMFDEPQAPQTMEELTVPNSFDWKTTKEVNLTLTAQASGIVEVANSQLVAYQKAFLNPGSAYTMKLTVPSYEKNVKLRFLGQEVTIELTSTSIAHQFN